MIPFEGIAGKPDPGLVGLDLKGMDAGNDTRHGYLNRIHFD